MTSPSWRLQAACVDSPVDFFPTGVSGRGGNTRSTDERRAIAVCEPCPVRVECLDYALVEQIRFGVWGGTGPDDRQRLMQRRAA